MAAHSGVDANVIQRVNQNIERLEASMTQLQEAARKEAKDNKETQQQMLKIIGGISEDQQVLKKHTEEGFTVFAARLTEISATQADISTTQASLSGDMGKLHGDFFNIGKDTTASLDEMRRKIEGKADLPDETMQQSITLQAQRRNLPEPEDAPERHRVRAMRSAVSTDSQPAIAADQSST